MLRIVEQEHRTHAAADARQNHQLRPAVPDRDGELTIEARKEIESVMQISGQQEIDLGVAPKRHALAAEFGEQCPVIEDFTVERDDDVSIGADGGLLTASEIQNGRTS